jgi:predicted phosphoribosyltransferase
MATEPEFRVEIGQRISAALERATPTERRGRKVIGLKSVWLQDRGIAEGVTVGAVELVAALSPISTFVFPPLSPSAPGNRLGVRMNQVAVTYYS